MPALKVVPGWVAVWLVVWLVVGCVSADVGRDGAASEVGIDVVQDGGAILPDGARDGDAFTGGGDAAPAFVLEWRSSYVAGGGPVSCEAAGTPTVKVVLRHLATSTVITERFACSAGTGVSWTLPAGGYEITASLEDQQGRAVSQIVGGPFFVRSGSGIHQVVEFQIQSFEIAWSLVRTGAASTCAAANAEVVHLIAKLGSESPEVFRFPCQAAGGVTTAIRLGQYEVQLQLRSGMDSVLSETASMSLRVTELERPVLNVLFELR